MEANIIRNLFVLIVVRFLSILGVYLEHSFFILTIIFIYIKDLQQQITRLFLYSDYNIYLYQGLATTDYQVSNLG